MRQICFNKLVILIMKTIHCIWNKFIADMSQTSFRRTRHIENENNKFIAKSVLDRVRYKWKNIYLKHICYRFCFDKFIILIMKTTNLSQILFRQTRYIDHEHKKFVADFNSTNSLYWTWKQQICRRFVTNLSQNLFWQTCYIQCEIINWSQISFQKFII